MRHPYYFEPWRVWRDTTWDLAFRHGPPQVEDLDVVARWHNDRAKAEQSAKAVVFGSDLAEPGVTTSLTGEIGVHDGDGILFSVRPFVTDHPSAASHVELAERVATCVNAMAGIAKPTEALAAARSLILDLARGAEIGPRDKRVTRLLTLLWPVSGYPSIQKRVFGSGENECD